MKELIVSESGGDLDRDRLFLSIATEDGKFSINKYYDNNYVGKIQREADKKELSDINNFKKHLGLD